MRARIALALTLGLAATTARADDWPQCMGPQRDNVWRETGLIDKFPAGGPKVLWRTPVAGGYAGPAVAGGKVFVTDFKTDAKFPEGNWKKEPADGTESVICLDEKTGKEVWKHSYTVRYTLSYPAGPRCTPTVDGDLVYFLGAEGNLLAVTISTGKIAWQNKLKEEYKTGSAMWGYAAHPLIDGDKLITLAGGEGSHVVALDKKTGKEIWKSQTQKEQGYVPPSIITAGGVRQLIVPGAEAVRSLDPETGKRHWSVPYEASSGSIIMTPVVSGEYMFVGGYNNKTQMLKLAADKPAAEVVWENKRGLGLSPVNVQPFLQDGVIYGHDQSGTFYAVEVPSGKRLWEGGGPLGEGAKSSGTSFIVKQADRFWFFTETGDLVIGKLSPKGYEEIDRAKALLAPTDKGGGRDVVWSAAAFANKHAYIRNGKEIICVDLAAK